MRPAHVLAASMAIASAAYLSAAVPATHRVTLDASGAPDPAIVTIRNGDTVEWTFAKATQSVVAASTPTTASCPTPRAFVSSDPANFTGPVPFAPGGVYALAPLEDRGLNVQRTPCGRGGVTANGRSLCGNGAPLTTMDETWADPNTTGVFIRLLWNRLQTAPGTADRNFDFTDLDREVSQAVRHGKLYSLAIKAGNDGTPDWLFTAGVTRLEFQDGGSDVEMRTACGPRMVLGDPTEAAYQRHYFDMLMKVAEHLRARGDWYRALAYIKPAGANLFSHENRLPKRCSPGCICNPEVFARNGYTPSKLYDFYKKQFALLKQEFPGKAISYQLIQDGFPGVNDSGGWETAEGRSSNGRPLPGGAEQTEHIIEMGQDQLGSLFVVQHNGLQVYRTACDVDGERAGGRGGRAGRLGRAGAGGGGLAVGVGTGCPNRWVLQAGADGKTITGFQTTNLNGVRTPDDVDSALRNAYENSRGVFVELYEGPIWVAVNLNGGRLPSGRTLGEWAELFQKRRREVYRSLGDPQPLTYRHTFNNLAPGTYAYYEPASCRAGSVVITGPR